MIQKSFLSAVSGSKLTVNSRISCLGGKLVFEIAFVLLFRMCIDWTCSVLSERFNDAPSAAPAKADQFIFRILAFTFSSPRPPSKLQTAIVCVCVCALTLFTGV